MKLSEADKIKLIKLTCEATEENFGSSLNANCEKPKKGFMVSSEKYGEKCKFFELESKLHNFLESNSDALNSRYKYLGTWYNEEDGFIYVDISINIMDFDVAVKIGLSENQKAIYSVEEERVVNLSDYIKED